MSENTELEFFETSARTGEGVSEVSISFIMDDLHFDLMAEIYRDMICHVLAGIYGSCTADQRISRQKGQFTQKIELILNFRIRS